MKSFLSIKVLLFVAIISSLFACSQTKEDIVVKGQINGLSNEKVTLNELSVGELKVLDSVVSDQNGTFNFQYGANQTGFYLLQTPQRQIPLILKPGETVKVFANVNSINEFYTVDGPLECQIMNDFENVTRRNESLIDSLAQKFESAQYQDNFEQEAMKLNATFDSIYQVQVEYVKALIKSHPDKLASLLIMSQPFGPRRVINEEEDFDLVRLVDQKIMQAYPDNPHAQENHKRFLELEKVLEEERQIKEKLLPGNPAPDIAMPNLAKDTVKLSDLKGQTVLVYFWGALDLNSRKANNKLVQLYNDYKKDGFEVYGISIDYGNEVIERTILEDNIEWITLCDNRGLSSPSFQIYRVPEKIPFFVLVDKEGIIKYRGNNFDEMERTLKKEF